MATNGNGRSDSERQKIDEMLGCLPNLKAFAISLCGNATRAEDLVQQTVLQALTSLGKFELGTNMGAWLFTILRNRFRSEHRKKQEQEWNPGLEDALFFSTGLSQGEAEATHEFRSMLLFLACLPAEQADALIAIGYLCLSYDDTAEALDCAVGTVKSRVNRAREMLAELIKSGRIVSVDLSRLQTATRGVPQSHPYFPIAKAYEELYAALEGVSEIANGKAPEDAAVPKSERLWQELVASGALDDEYDLGDP